MPEPQLLRLLRVPRERAARPVQLEPQCVLTAGAHLGHGRAHAAALQPKQQMRDVFRDHLHIHPLHVVRGGERLHLAGRTLPHRQGRRQVGEDRFDPPAAHPLREIHPVRADVSDGPQCPALLGLEAPVPVNG